MKKITSLALTVLSTCALVACGGSGSSKDTSPNNSNLVVRGTVAVGAPLSQADISVRCGAEVFTTRTNNLGNYQISQALLDEYSASLPCAMEVLNDYGSLYSYSQTSGVTNITPFTTLAVADAVASSGVDVASWFSTLSADTDWGSFGVGLEEAQENLIQRLETLTGETVSFDFFSTAFTADSSNEYDVWLDGFSLELERLGQTFHNVLDSYVKNGFAGFDFNFSDLEDILNNLPDNDSGVAEGTSNLHITMYMMGGAFPVDAGVSAERPATEAEFCMVSGVYIADQYQITSCSFNPSAGTGEITALMNGMVEVRYVFEYR